MLRSMMRVFLPVALFAMSIPYGVTQTFSSQTLDFDSSAENVSRADFNHDGNLDLVIVGIGNNVRILLGDGHGNFTTSVFQVGCCVLTGLPVADYNGDSHPDLLVVDLETEAAFTFYTISGNGDGTFKPPIVALHRDSGRMPFPVAGDFDGDGKVDLVASQEIAGQKGLWFLYGDGKGHFPREARTPSGTVPPEQVVGEISPRDVDNDGDTDLLVVFCCNPFEVELYRNDGKGTFSPEHLFRRAIDQFHPVWADMNQDNLVDLMTVDRLSCEASQCHNLGVTFNPLVSKDRIQTRLPDPADYAFDSLEYNNVAVAADFNNDGFIDEAYQLLAVRPDFADFQALAMSRQNPDGSFAPPISLYFPQTFFSTTRLLPGDFDNDGRTDLLLGNQLLLNTTDSIPRCSAGALRTVNLCLPANNSMLSAPVQILATPHSGLPILAMKIYVDGVAQLTSTDERISVRLNLTPGKHQITAKAWDRLGGFGSTIHINVDRGSLCTATTDRSVKICSPIINSFGSDQFRVLAGLRSDSGVQAAQVYLDGSLVYSAPSGRYYIDRSFTAARGAHRITVKGWDLNGAFSSSVNITLP